MWIINFLPDWTLYITIITGLSIVGLIISNFIPTQLKYLVQGVSSLALFFGLFISGALYNNRAWVERVKEMEEKVAKSQEESSKQNVKIVEKVVTKNKIVKEKGEEVIRYVDKEIVKYDNSCVIPKEFIKAHNDAAKGE